MTQRYKAIEFAEKRIANLTGDEAVMQQWNVARHFELVPKDEDNTAADQEIKAAQKAESRLKLLGAGKKDKKQIRPTSSRTGSPRCHSVAVVEIRICVKLVLLF